MLGPVRKIECPDVREYTQTLILEHSDCLAKQVPVKLRAPHSEKVFFMVLDVIPTTVE